MSDVLQNMNGAMQYSTQGVNNDNVYCVKGYLHTRHTTYN